MFDMLLLVGQNVIQPLRTTKAIFATTFMFTPVTFGKDKCLDQKSRKKGSVASLSV